jgi:signal transduction histidine kinase
MKRRRPDSPKIQTSLSAREREPSGQLDLLIHDLRNCFSAIRFAQYFLDDRMGLSPQEQATYQTVLRSNLSQATGLMDQLLQAAPVTSKQANSSAQSRTALLIHLSSQLPERVASESADQLAHLKKLVEIGLQGD